MTDNNKTGLGSDNMDPQTKHDIQSQGGKSSHSRGKQNQDTSSQGMKGGQSSNQSSGSSSRGLGAMEEQGRDEEVSEITSLGGQASRSGGRNQDE